MALSQTLLSTAIKTALEQVQVEAATGANVDDIQQAYADAIAEAVYTWILTATITVAPGQVVQTVPATGTGATTTPGTGTLS